MFAKGGLGGAEAVPGVVLTQGKKRCYLVGFKQFLSCCSLLGQEFRLNRRNWWDCIPEVRTQTGGQLGDRRRDRLNGGIE